jgi:hypothetical protein
MFHPTGRLASLCVAGLLASIVPGAEPERTVPDAVPAKVLRYAQRLLKTYDADGDGQLQPAEWQNLPADARGADANGDGVITLDELAAYIARYGKQHSLRTVVPLAPPAETAPVFAPVAEAGSRGAGEQGSGGQQAKSAEIAVAGPTDISGQEGRTADGEKSERPAKPIGTKFHVSASRLPPGLPDWFRQRDLDGDGQLTLSEFAPNPAQAQIDEFNRLDANHDGVVTAREYMQAVSPKKTAKPSKPPEPAGKKAMPKTAP